MNIGGLRRLSLLDFPGRLACTVFLSGCNLRCPYCHNPALVLPAERSRSGLPESELFAFLEQRRGKLDGVCISGGEPTLHKELPRLLRLIRQSGFLTKLDTNGTAPAMLEALLREGLLDYVAMDIKNAPSLYAQTCGGIDRLAQVRESAALLLGSGVDYEFRTTVCAPLHTPEAMVEIGQWLQGAKRYFLQPFVDPGALLGSGVTPLPHEAISTLRDSVLPYIPATEIRGQSAILYI